MIVLDDVGKNPLWLLLSSSKQREPQRLQPCPPRTIFQELLCVLLPQGGPCTSAKARGGVWHLAFEAVDLITATGALVHCRHFQTGPSNSSSSCLVSWWPVRRPGMLQALKTSSYPLHHTTLTQLAQGSPHHLHLFVLDVGCVKINKKSQLKLESGNL